MTDLFDPLPAATGTRRKANTHSRLVRASLDVFVEKGLDGATVDDLARAAGFTRGAFYSNFSSKEEVFTALFASVTEELLSIIDRSVSDAVARRPDGRRRSDDDAALVLAIFEAIRPYGRQWYLLYSEAVARSLRDEALRSDLTAQRERLRRELGSLLGGVIDQSGGTPVLALDDLAQLLIGIFIDLMVREQMDGLDVTDLAATTILGTLRAFITPPAENELI